VIIFVIDGIGIFPDKYKCNSPVSTNPHCPATLTIPLELMKTQSRQVHIFWVYGHIESTEEHPQPFSVLGLDPALLPVEKNFSSPLCLKPRITKITVTYVVTARKTSSSKARTGFDFPFALKSKFAQYRV
jgi:hypothetical protein